MAREENDFVRYVVDMMQIIGPVTSKAMFSGHGLFLGGLMFAIIVDNVLYLKADKQNENDFREQGLEPFEYNKKGKTIKMSYYQAPEESLEDSEVMRNWANSSYNAALRSR